MSKKTGLDMFSYYGDALLASGDIAGFDLVTWNQIANTRDETINNETGQAEINRRGLDYEAALPTLKNGEITMQILYDTTDATYQAFKAAWSARTPIAAAFLDGNESASGTQGTAGNYSVTNFTENRPLTEAVTIDITLKPESFVFEFVRP